MADREIIVDIGGKGVAQNIRLSPSTAEKSVWGGWLKITGDQKVDQKFVFPPTSLISETGLVLPVTPKVGGDGLVRPGARGVIQLVIDGPVPPGNYEMELGGTRSTVTLPTHTEALKSTVVKITVPTPPRVMVSNLSLAIAKSNPSGLLGLDPWTQTIKVETVGDKINVDQADLELTDDRGFTTHCSASTIGFQPFTVQKDAGGKTDLNLGRLPLSPGKNVGKLRMSGTGFSPLDLTLSIDYKPSPWIPLAALAFGVALGYLARIFPEDRTQLLRRLQRTGSRLAETKSSDPVVTLLSYKAIELQEAVADRALPLSELEVSVTSLEKVTYLIPRYLKLATMSRGSGDQAVKSALSAAIASLEALDAAAAETALGSLSTALPVPQGQMRKEDDDSSQIPSQRVQSWLTLTAILSFVTSVLVFGGIVVAGYVSMYLETTYRNTIPEIMTLLAWGYGSSTTGLFVWAKAPANAPKVSTFP